MNNNRILVVDDEKDIRDVLTILLEHEGYSVTTAENGADALSIVKQKGNFRLIIMDIIMPEMSGTQAAEKIRETTDSPILFLTARSTDNDKIEAYNAGGDDYLSKPFSRVELLLRVQALFKRYAGNDTGSQDVILEESSRSVIKNSAKIKLTDKEFELLSFLHSNRGTAYSIRDIYEHIWGEKYMPSSSNTVMVHILNLRKKLEDDFANPQLIQTVWGKGYCYAEIKN